MKFREFKNGIKNEFQKTGCWIAGVTKKFIRKAEDDSKSFVDDIVQEEEEAIELFIKGMENSNESGRRDRNKKEEMKEKEGVTH